MAIAADIIKKSEKSYGKGVVQQGALQHDVERISTGIFPLDLAMGGGFPRGKISIVYGMESSGKTNIMYKTIALEQKLNPTKKIVFIDAEHSFDAKWAATMGVNVEMLILVVPHHAEQVVDIVEAFLYAEDVGLIVIDSIAAMIPKEEGEKDAEGNVMGGNSRVVGKLVRKTLMAQSKCSLDGRYPTLICINQIRYKVGGMGDPETCPGGKVLPFYSAMTLRCYGKNVNDSAVSTSLPATKETSVIVKKWKVPITAANVVYNMAMLPQKNMAVGDVSDFNTIVAYAKDYGFLVKEKNAWAFNGKEFSTLVQLKEWMLSDLEMYSSIKADLVNLALKSATSGEVMASGLD